MAWDEKLVLALNSAFSAVISMCNQVVTSEVREKFHARFCPNQAKLFPNFTSIPFN